METENYGNSHVSRQCALRAARVPPNPDAEPDPKTTLIDLARRSRRRAIREDIVPREGSGSRVGPGYAGRLIEFVMTAGHPWRPNVAAQHSDSLRRCVEALQALKTGLRMKTGDWGRSG